MAALGFRPGAEDDCNKLLNIVLPAAKQLLENRGEFSPFGAALKSNGEIVFLGGYGEPEHSGDLDQRKAFWDGFRAGVLSGEYRATARTYPAVDIESPSTGEKSAAVMVALDHRDQYSVAAFFLYQIENGKFILAESFTVKGGGDLFRSP